MSRLRSGILTLVLFSAACPISLAADDAEKPAQPKPPAAASSMPLQVALRYAKQLKDGDPVDAVRRYWDLDRALEIAFGDALKKVSAADREQMKRLLLEYVEHVHTDPVLAARLSQATLEGFRAKVHDGPPKTATVNYYMVFKGERTLCTVLMRQSPDQQQQWRITDSGAMGQMVVATIRKEYGKQIDQMTPLEFMQDLVSRVRRS